MNGYMLIHWPDLVVGEERIHKRECSAVRALTGVGGRYGVARGCYEKRYGAYIYCAEVWSDTLTPLGLLEAASQASKPR